MGHIQDEAVTRLRNANLNISKSLILLGSSVNSRILADLRRTKEQLEYDIEMLVAEINADDTLIRRKTDDA